MKKLILVTIIIVAICFGVVEWKFKSHAVVPATPQQTQQTADQTTNSDVQPTNQPQQLVVSNDDLVKLQAQNLVSADTKYYIKQATPFPKIVDLGTGNEYLVKPSATYTKITKLSWSGDGQTLAYIYQVSDPDYANQDLLNTVSVREVVNQQFINSSRVLVAAGKLDYVWYDAQKILYSALQNYDANKKFYTNGSIGVYDIKTESFVYPLQDSSNLVNLYSISLASTASKFLYVQAKLDDTGSTIGQQYVVANLDGSVVGTTNSYNANWNK